MQKELLLTEVQGDRTRHFAHRAENPAMGRWAMGIAKELNKLESKAN